MDASGQNYKDIFRYTDVEYTPEGHTDVYRWDGPSRGLVAANSLRDLIGGKGSADALVDCRIDRLVDTNGTFSIEASHHDGTAYLDVRLISGVSFDGKGFRLGGERYAPGKMDLDDFHILLGNLYDAPGVGPCSLPHFAERAYGAAQQSYRFGETVFDIYCETGGTDRPYKVMVSAGESWRSYRRTSFFKRSTGRFRRRIGFISDPSIPRIRIHVVTSRLVALVHLATLVLPSPERPLPISRSEAMPRTAQLT